MILTFIYPLKSFGYEGDKGDRKEGSVGTVGQLSETAREEKLSIFCSWLPWALGL